MKNNLVRNIYIAGIVLIFALIHLHAPLAVMASVLWPEMSLVWKSWKEIVMVLLVIPAGYLAYTHKRLGQLVKDRLLQLSALYVLVYVVVAAVIPTGRIATSAGFAIDLRYVLFFALVYVMVRLYPSSVKPAIMAVSIGATVVVGFAVIQQALPRDALEHIGYSKDTILPYLLVDNDPAYVRVNSTLRGPNPLGAYAILALSLVMCRIAAVYRVSSRRQWLYAGSFLTATLCALWFSYSRGAMLGAVITGFIIFLMAMARQSQLKKAIIVSSLVVLMVVGLLFVWKDHSLVRSVVFHESGDSRSSVTNIQHASSLREGARAIAERPGGYGVGSVGSASMIGGTTNIVENQYLAIAHEVGVLGLLLFVILYITILVRLWKKRSSWLATAVFASGIGLSVVGLALPVWADDTVSLVWWGLAALAIAAPRERSAGIIKA